LGLSSSAWIATRSLIDVANNLTQNPKAKKSLTTNFFVDDYIESFQYITTVNKTINEIYEAQKKVSWTLSKYESTHKIVVPGEEKQKHNKNASV
jgi:hypothetical protein